MNPVACYCHQPEQETVFELDEASTAMAETILKSPEYKKVDLLGKESPQNFQQAVSGKPMQNDDLYSLRPMKVATPISNRSVGNRLSPQQTGEPPGGSAGSTHTYDRGAEHLRGGFESGGAASQYPDAGRVGVLSGSSAPQVDLLIKEPGITRQTDAVRSSPLRGDVSPEVQEELLRLKQSLHDPERQKVFSPVPASADEPESGTDHPALASVEAETNDSGDAARREKEDRKLKLRAEVAALKDQVLKAKAARIERAGSLDKEFSMASVDSAEDVDDGQPGRGPDLWGARRRIEELPAEPVPDRRQQCLPGGADRSCFPARQCA